MSIAQDLNRLGQDTPFMGEYQAQHDQDHENDPCHGDDFKIDGDIVAEERNNQLMDDTHLLH